MRPLSVEEEKLLKKYLALTRAKDRYRLFHEYTLSCLKLYQSIIDSIEKIELPQQIDLDVLSSLLVAKAKKVRNKLSTEEMVEIFEKMRAFTLNVFKTLKEGAVV